MSDSDEMYMDSWRSWFVCLGCFLCQVIVLGFLHAYGVFFVVFLEEFKESKAKTAWIASLAYGITMFLGPAVGYLINRMGHRAVAMSGSVVCTISLIASSFATSINMLFGTFAVLYGIGMSLNYTPTMCIADRYFRRHIVAATGIMMSGSSVGTLIMSISSKNLVEKFGWAVTFRVMAGLVLFSAVCGMTFQPLPSGRGLSLTQLQHSKKPPPPKKVLWKNAPYLVWLLSVTFAMFGYFIPYVHLVSHTQQSLGFTDSEASTLMMTLGAATATGRIVFGKILGLTSSTTKKVYAIMCAMTATGVAFFILPTLKSFSMMLVYVITMGLLDGCIVVLLPVLTYLLAGKGSQVIAWGVVSCCSSVTFTLGPPVAGYLSDATGSYTLAFRLAGIPLIIAASILALIPFKFNVGHRAHISNSETLAECTARLGFESPPRESEMFMTTTSECSTTRSRKISQELEDVA